MLSGPADAGGSFAMALSRPVADGPSKGEAQRLRRVWLAQGASPDEIRMASLFDGAEWVQGAWRGNEAHNVWLSAGEGRGTGTTAMSGSDFPYAGLLDRLPRGSPMPAQLPRRARVREGMIGNARVPRGDRLGLACG